MLLELLTLFINIARPMAILYTRPLLGTLLKFDIVGSAWNIRSLFNVVTVVTHLSGPCNSTDCSASPSFDLDPEWAYPWRWHRGWLTEHVYFQARRNGWHCESTTPSSCRRWLHARPPLWGWKTYDCRGCKVILSFREHRRCQSGQVTWRPHFLLWQWQWRI